MHIYIDESGNTGQNLFDPNQPNLLYGVLSSPRDLDVELAPLLATLAKKYGFQEMHAAELGMAMLSRLAPALTRMQRGYEISFDLYRIDKKHHAIISFFDQVFDSGVNKAVPGLIYWTPLRYLYLLTLAPLFDEELAKRAWLARLTLRRQAANAELVEICKALIPRAAQLPDPRAKEVIVGALEWAAARPEEILYNVSDKAFQKSVSPNLISFQSVLIGLSRRCRQSRRTASQITVDEQSEFNRGQQSLHTMYRRMAGVEMPVLPHMPKCDLDHLPDLPLTISSGKTSAGLQVADVYLWLMQRFHVRSQPWPREFTAFAGQLYKTGLYDEVSLDALAQRWIPQLNALPEPTSEQLAKARELQRDAEERRTTALSKMHVKGPEPQ